jgi:hypothetical protein
MLLVQAFLNDLKKIYRKNIDEGIIIDTFTSLSLRVDYFSRYKEFNKNWDSIAQKILIKYFDYSDGLVETSFDKIFIYSKSLEE